MSYKANQSELQFFEMLKAIGMILAMPFLLIGSVCGLAWSAIEGSKADKERGKEQLRHEEFMRNIREEMSAQNALPFRGDTAALEAEVSRAFLDAPIPSDDEIYERLDEALATAIKNRTVRLPCLPIAERWEQVAEYLGTKKQIFALPPRRAFVDRIDEGRYRDELKAAAKLIENPDETVARAIETVMTASKQFLDHLPPMARASRSNTGARAPFTEVSLIDILPDTGAAIEAISFPFIHGAASEIGLFQSMRKRLLDNGEEVRKTAGKYVLPSDYKVSPRECVRAYLHDTVLEYVFDATVPFDIPLSRRMEHTAIVAGSGVGKTQLLQSMILHDLRQDDPPALVVIDPTGQMVKRIQRLALFADRLKDRIIVVDPEQDPVPALNMFDVSSPRLQGYRRGVREEVETEIVNLFNYVFSTLATELTGRQSTAFSFIVRLLLAMPGANIHTLRELLEDEMPNGAPKFRRAIANLDTTAQAFFTNHFYSKSFYPTRRQIAQRLYAVIQIPAFERMFSTTNKLDMFAELQRGSIILINTSTRLLKEEGSPLFARYMIARTLAAVFERAAIPEEERHPAFLIIDEAAQAFDETFDAMLARVRQFKLGLVLAFQHLEQASEKLRSSIASNTSVKLAAGLGYSDARWMSRDMHTTPEFIQAQKRDPADPPTYTQFACYVRNYTDQAVSLTVPIGAMEREPTMTREQHAELLARNLIRIADLPQDLGSGELPEAEPEPTAAPEPAKRPDAKAGAGEGSEGAVKWD